MCVWVLVFRHLHASGGGTVGVLVGYDCVHIALHVAVSGAFYGLHVQFLSLCPLVGGPAVVGPPAALNPVN